MHVHHPQATRRSVASGGSLRCSHATLSDPWLGSEPAEQGSGSFGWGHLALLTASSRQVYVRLAQVDAPEKAQPYGQAAKQALSRRVESVPALTFSSLDRASRLFPCSNRRTACSSFFEENRPGNPGRLLLLPRRIWT